MDGSEHLEAHDGDVFLVGAGVWRVLAAEPFDDHRFAVVRRSDQKEVGHALFAGPVIECFEPGEGLDRPGVPDPTVSPDAPDPFLRRQTGHGLGPGLEMGEIRRRVVIDVHHCSTSSKGRAAAVSFVGGSISSGGTAGVFAVP
jgi:hypothetical protein